MSTATDDDEKVRAALTQAVRLLETAVREQEAAANRILGLAEQIQATAPTRPLMLKADAVMEACGFQDLSGQKIRKVMRLIRYLRDKKMVAAGELPGTETEPLEQKGGLSQAEVDRLLSGKRL